MRPDGVHLAALAIDFMGSLFIAGYCMAAFLAISRSRIYASRLLIAEGALAGLGFKTVSALLNTLVLKSWHAIAIFTVVLSLRLFLKRVFLWESQRAMQYLRNSTPPRES